MAINSTTTTLATHPAGATALSTLEAHAEARTTTTATPLTPGLEAMLPTLMQNGTQGSAAPSVFSYTPPQQYEHVAVAPAAALAVLEILAPGALAALGVGLYGLFQNKSLNALSLGLGSRGAGIDDPNIMWRDSGRSTSGRSGQSPVVSINSIVQTMRNAGLSPALATRMGVELRQLQGSTESRKFATNLQTSPQLLGIAMVRAMQHVHGFSDTQANSLLAQMARMSANPTKLIAFINQSARAAVKPAGQPSQLMFSAATIQRLQQMLPTTGVLAALQAAGIQVNKPTAALNTLQAQAAQYNALQQLRRSPDWPALSARLAPELASLQTSLQKMMNALSAQATSRMEAAATLLHLGRALTAPELNQLKTIHADLMRFQGQITAAYTPLQRAGLYENPLNPTVLQIKKQVGKIWSKIGERFRGLQDRAGRTADGVGQFIPGSGGAGSRRRVAQRDAAREQIEQQDRRRALLANSGSSGRTPTPEGGSTSSQPPDGGRPRRGPNKWVVGGLSATVGYIASRGWEIFQGVKQNEVVNIKDARTAAGNLLTNIVPENPPKFMVLVKDGKLVSPKIPTTRELLIAGIKQGAISSTPLTPQQSQELKKHIDLINRINQNTALDSEDDQVLVEMLKDAKKTNSVMNLGLRAYLNYQEPGTERVELQEFLASPAGKRLRTADGGEAEFKYYTRDFYDHYLALKERELRNIEIVNTLGNAKVAEQKNRLAQVLRDSVAELNPTQQAAWMVNQKRIKALETIKLGKAEVLDIFKSEREDAENIALTTIPPLPDNFVNLDEGDKPRALKQNIEQLTAFINRLEQNSPLKIAARSELSKRQDMLRELQTDRTRLFMDSYKTYAFGGGNDDYGEVRKENKVYITVKGSSRDYEFVLPIRVITDAKARKTEVEALQKFLTDFRDELGIAGVVPDVRSMVNRRISAMNAQGGEKLRQAELTPRDESPPPAMLPDPTSEPLPLESGSGGDGTRAINPVETN